MQEGTDCSKHRTYLAERRSSTRYEIHGAAWFRWKTRDGIWHEGNGTTCNVCRSGAFIESDAVPPVGSQLHVELALQVVWGKDVQIKLCGGGSVRHLRHEMKGSDGYGAWVAFRTDAPPWTEPRRGQTDPFGHNDVSGGNEVKAPLLNWIAPPTVAATAGNGCAN